MRSLLIAMIAVTAMAGCAAAPAEDAEEVGSSTENLTTVDIMSYQPFRTIASSERSYVDSLALTQEEWTGGRGGNFTITRCQAGGSNEPCSAKESGSYLLKLDPSTRKFYLELTPANGSAMRKLPVDSSSTIPSLQGGDAETYFGKGHPSLAAAAPQVPFSD